jgi:hypothetical protein
VRHLQCQFHAFNPDATSFSGVQAGAIFVNQSATSYFKTLFSTAGLDDDDVKEYTAEAIESFESEKKHFEGPHQDDIGISVGGHRFSDKSIGVRRGLMNMSWYEHSSIELSGS